MISGAEDSGATAERILVVDDEPDIVALVTYHLARAGYGVSTASTGPQALAKASSELPALIVLDLMLPGMSGFEVLQRLRADQATAQIAVLTLTARREEPDRVRGLTLGADDYLTKPFSPQELTLRVGAIIRRLRAPATASVDIVKVGSVRIDRAAHEVRVDDDIVELTPTEYKLLLTLAERKGRVLARTLLLETVWDAAPDIQTRTVDMHVQRLRAKLGPSGDMIETVRGFGYRIHWGTTKNV
ncbi:MAG: response regulator transcription factor [Gemmatimonadota bacterium]|nr:response regulator transcription factor [Gemmatimonadota bacterium]